MQLHVSSFDIIYAGQFHNWFFTEFLPVDPFEIEEAIKASFAKSPIFSPIVMP